MYYTIITCSQITYLLVTYTYFDNSIKTVIEREIRHSFSKEIYNTANTIQNSHNQNTVITSLNNVADEKAKTEYTIDINATDRLNIRREKLHVDYSFAKRLRQAQNNTDIPLVNDIIVSKKNNSWEIIIIINNGNVRDIKYRELRSVNVLLLIGSNLYYNSFKEVRDIHLRVLKYQVPHLPVFGTISLFDSSTNNSYYNLPYKALIYQPKRKLAICAYISNYNTINEIKSFLAYYILQKVDNIILYCTVNCDIFKNALKKEIESGYVILYEYPWPLTKNYGAYQRSIQGSQINSCYYRHRNYFEYIISQDVDEYFYSEQYPYDLYTAIRMIYKVNPERKSLAVNIIFVYHVGKILFVFGKRH